MVSARHLATAAHLHLLDLAIRVQVHVVALESVGDEQVFVPVQIHIEKNRCPGPFAGFQANDFQPFPRSDGPWSPTNFWNGGAWDWHPDNVPWDIGQAFIHPNGVNSGGMEHWSIRRWRSTVSGRVTIRFFLRKDNLNGSGVTGKIFRNGEELFSKAIAGGDGVVVFQDQRATFSAAMLLANDTGPDGSALLLVGVNPNCLTSAGGTVRLYGDQVRYAPPPGFLGPDSFVYTVSDAAPAAGVED